MSKKLQVTVSDKVAAYYEKLGDRYGAGVSSTCALVLGAAMDAGVTLPGDSRIMGTDSGDFYEVYYACGSSWEEEEKVAVCKDYDDAYFVADSLVMANEDDKVISRIKRAGRVEASLGISDVDDRKILIL